MNTPPPLTLIGRRCGHCGAYDCQKHARVSLPTEAKPERAVVEGNYWDVCGRCGYALAYCKGH